MRPAPSRGAAARSVETLLPAGDLTLGRGIEVHGHSCHPVWAIRPDIGELRES